MAALLLAYFGMQSGLSLYMKVVFSSALISEDLQLYGLPAPFLVTGAQQLVTFVPVLLWLVLGLLAPSLRRTWSPGPVNTRSEWAAVCLYSLSFAVNIGLNNLSLSLLGVSVNLVIRSCTPMAVAILEWLQYRFVGKTEGGDAPPRPPASGEALVMLVGVAFAGLATVASHETMSSPGMDSDFILGVSVCCLSVLFAACNLVLARTLGLSFGMNPVDSAVYTTLPTTLFLALPALSLPHPVAWPGHPRLTDWQVFAKVWQLSPETLGLVLVSGVFAAGFNVVQFVLARSLTATHVAFAGNFNKAATMVLSITLGLERLPGGLWSDVMVMSLLGNVAMFTVFSVATAQAEAEAEAGAAGKDDRLEDASVASMRWDADDVAASEAATSETEAATAASAAPTADLLSSSDDGGPPADARAV